MGVASRCYGKIALFLKKTLNFEYISDFRWVFSFSSLAQALPFQAKAGGTGNKLG
jgi:hypothetical protein